MTFFGGILTYGRIDEAVAEYEMATNINPYYAEAYNNLGIGHEYQGRREESIASFKAALMLNPD